MQSFIFGDAIRFKLATQQEDTNAKIQVFFGVLIGVLLRWLYGIIVDVIKGGPWDFGTWSVIIARIVIALISTIFRLFRVLGKSERPASWYAIS